MKNAGKNLRNVSWIKFYARRYRQTRKHHCEEPIAHTRYRRCGRDSRGRDLKERFEKVLARGELTVATLNGHTTYFKGANSPAGFAYHLARAFADYWCADLRVLGPSDHTRAFPMVALGDGRGGRFFDHRIARR